MPTVEVLKERREKARHREERVEKLEADGEVDLGRVLRALADERDERDAFEKHRKEIRKALDAEIAADVQGDGEHSEAWEFRKEAKRDELADLIDASEGRIGRLLEHASKEKGALVELRKRDSKLERRIEILTKKIEDKKDPKGQLTKDFHVEEFNCNNGQRVVVDVPQIIPHLRALCVAHLQPLRDSGGLVGINSAYRPKAYNDSIGGAEFSYHRYEYRLTAPAADHIQSGRSATSVQAWHDSHNRPDAMGYYPGFTHIDDRGYYVRWYGAA